MRSSSNKVVLPLGRTVATPIALAELERAKQKVDEFLRRHECGDWGEVQEEDWAANDRALKTGERILSSYKLRTGETIWIITEADRSSTTLLLPSEY